MTPVVVQPGPRVSVHNGLFIGTASQTSMSRAMAGSILTVYSSLRCLKDSLVSPAGGEGLLPFELSESLRWGLTAFKQHPVKASILMSSVWVRIPIGLCVALQRSCGSNVSPGGYCESDFSESLCRPIIKYIIARLIEYIAEQDTEFGHLSALVRHFGYNTNFVIRFTVHLNVSSVIPDE